MCVLGLHRDASNDNVLGTILAHLRYLSNDCTLEHYMFLVAICEPVPQDLHLVAAGCNAAHRDLSRREVVHRCSRCNRLDPWKPCVVQGLQGIRGVELAGSASGTTRVRAKDGDSHRQCIASVQPCSHVTHSILSLQPRPPRGRGFFRGCCVDPWQLPCT